MRTRHILPILLFLFTVPLFSEDYQFQYFSDPESREKYVPFSDYIPRNRLHYKTVPHYLEDFYLLYSMKQHYGYNHLHKNIAILQTALQKRFRHPSRALVKVETEKEYLKYRRILFMHINLLIMRNHLKLGARYDMRKVRFYNESWKKEILDSFKTAESYYRDALPYWEKAREYAHQASEIRVTTELGTMESERYSIITGDLDYEKIINTYLDRLGKKREQLQSMQ